MRLSDIPNIETYLNKKVKIEVQPDSLFIGVLRGYDGFINIVLDDVVEPSSVNSYVVLKGKDIKSIVLVKD